MKNTILTLAALAIITAATAQTADSHKWYVSAGVGAMGNDLLHPAQYFEAGRLAAKTFPAFNVAVKRFITSSFAVGLSGGMYQYNNIHGYRKIGTPKLLDTSPVYEIIIGSEGKYRKTLSIAAECMQIYKRYDDASIILYGSAGLGITHTTGYNFNDGMPYFPNASLIAIDGYDPKTTIDENKWIAAIYPIGISGGKRLCWYGELGYGYKGILNVGVGYKL